MNSPDQNTPLNRWRFVYSTHLGELSGSERAVLNNIAFHDSGIQTRTRSVKQLTDAGLTLDQALVIVGLNEVK